MHEDRNLTDADIEALADAIETRMLGRFYGNIGRGFMSIVWKGAIIILLFLAAYGQYGGKLK